MPLPIIVNGKWFLLDDTTRIALPSTYTYVNLFDKNGLAFYLDGNTSGFIDQKGKEINRLYYENIEQIGSTMYLYTTDNGYEINSTTSNKKIKCDWSRQLEEDWLVYHKDSSEFIFNSNWNEGISLSDSTSIHYHFFNHLIIQSDTLLTLYDPKGNLLDNSKAELQHDIYYFYYKGDQAHLICNRNGSWNLPIEASNINIDEKYIHYTFQNKSYILEFETKKIIMSANCDYVDFFENNFLIRRGGLVGIINKNGGKLIPIEYSSIYKSIDYYIVTKNGLSGFLNLNFKEIIPCKYSYIYNNGDFFYTFSTLGYKGLISTKTYKEILPAVFEKITIQSSIIKAWSNSRLHIIELDHNQEIQNKIILDDVLTIHKKVNYDFFKNTHTPFDPRLLSIGWVYDTSSIIDNKKIWKGTRYSWGIKNEEDSLILKKTLPTPLYIDKADFSLLPIGKSKLTYMNIFCNNQQGEDKNLYNTYHFINYKTGEKNTKYIIYDFDSLDFQQYSFARFSHRNGFGIIDKGGNIISVSYIDPRDNEYIRYCTSNNYQFNNVNDKENVQVSGHLLKYQNNINYCHSPVKFNDAHWNYFNKNGDSLFQESFLYVQNFFKKTAIVKGEKGWGVVNKDSIVIPLEYASVERLSFFADTIFKVQLNHKNSIYLDSNLNLLPLTNMVYEQNTADISIFSYSGGYKIINSDNKIVKEGIKNLKVKQFSRIIYKEKKAYKIIDFKGNTIGESIHKPLDFLDENHFSICIDSKFGIINLEGDTIIPCDFDEITKIGTKIIAKQNSSTSLFTESYVLIKKIKEGIFLVDSISKNWSIIDSKSMTVFDLNNVRIYKWKTTTKFNYFYNDHFMTEKGIIFTADGVAVTHIPQHIDFKLFNDRYIALKDTKEEWHLYNSTWNEITKQELKNKNIVYHGDHVFSMTNKLGFMVYDLKNKKEYSHFTKITGDFSSTYILAEKNKKYFFIDRQFLDVFNRKFKKASSIINGFACVTEGSGWTIIGRDGLSKSLASYSGLKQIGPQLFESKSIPTFGFIDSEGNVIVKPIYEKITILPEGIIQAISEGEIHYFDYKGNILYKN